MHGGQPSRGAATAVRTRWVNGPSMLKSQQSSFSDANRRPASLTSMVAFLLVFMPIWYVAVYYLTVRRTGGPNLDEPYPVRYDGIPESAEPLFQPLHRLDRRLRRDFWYRDVTR